MKASKRIVLIVSLCAFLLSCGDDSSPDSQQESTNDIHVRIASNDNIALNNYALTYFVLYGYNSNDEHISARPLLNSSAVSPPDQQIPMELDVELSGEEGAWTCQDLNLCQARYYFYVLIDVDGDGLICPGDQVPDFSMTPFQDYSMAELTASEHEVYVKTKTGWPSDCVPPSEYYRKTEGIYQVLVRLIVADDVELVSDASGRVVIYGYNADLAEPSLIPIVSTFQTITPYNQVIELDIPLLDEPAPYVCQDDYPCSDRYMFAVEIDVDGDGRICPGDLIQDYDLSSLESYTLDELTTLGNEVCLTIKNGDPSECNDITGTDF